MQPEIDIKKLAKLAKLSLDDAECEGLLGDLKAMMALAEKLPEPPLTVSHGRVNVLREDIPGSCLTNDELLANAPDRLSDCFRVPRTVGGEV